MSFPVLGELGLDGSIAAVAGVLPAARSAPMRGAKVSSARRLRRRSGLGQPRNADRRRRIADPARQPFPRHASALVLLQACFRPLQALEVQDLSLPLFSFKGHMAEDIQKEIKALIES